MWVPIWGPPEGPKSEHKICPPTVGASILWTCWGSQCGPRLGFYFPDSTPSTRVHILVVAFLSLCEVRLSESASTSLPLQAYPASWSFLKEVLGGGTWKVAGKFLTGSEIHQISLVSSQEGHLTGLIKQEVASHTAIKLGEQPRGPPNRLKKSYVRSRFPCVSAFSRTPNLAKTKEKEHLTNTFPPWVLIIRISEKSLLGGFSLGFWLILFFGSNTLSRAFHVSGVGSWVVYLVIAGSPEPGKLMFPNAFC